MNPAKTVVFLSALLIIYSCLVYPLLIAALAALVRRAPRRLARYAGSVSVVLTSYNEAGTVGPKVEDLLGLLDSSGLEGEVIVVSDGSSDHTAAAARAAGGGRARVIDLRGNVGKAAALSAGCAVATGQALVLADARQRWAPDALVRLLENFAEPSVGAVSGDLLLESAPGVMAGVGFYWKYEKWLRRFEGQVHSTVGVTGAIAAVRRELFQPIPQGTILDDVYWPLRVVMQGHRVVHDTRARAYDRLPKKTADEFHRKVRTLSGNFQLLTLMPELLNPVKNPVWLQFVSHKLCRLVVPWAMLALLAATAVIHEPWYRVAFCAQIGFYLLGLAGLTRAVGTRLRPASAAASILVLNAAAWCAFWVWVTGRTRKSWRKADYTSVLQDSLGLTGEPRSPWGGSDR
jgi:glycosyltransferase involved in cell wall biosynthesis